MNQFSVIPAVATSAEECCSCNQKQQYPPTPFSAAIRVPAGHSFSGRALFYNNIRKPGTLPGKMKTMQGLLTNGSGSRASLTILKKIADEILQTS